MSLACAEPERVIGHRVIVGIVVDKTLAAVHRVNPLAMMDPKAENRLMSLEAETTSKHEGLLGCGFRV